jgi:hypothetical protein
MTQVPKIVRELDLDSGVEITLLGEHWEFPEVKPEIKKTICLHNCMNIEEVWEEIESVAANFFVEGYYTKIRIQLPIAEMLYDYL